jgi:hypothetical protein
VGNILRHVKFFFSFLFQKINQSPLVKILLLIIFIKFFVFYVVLKRYVYPRYLKPPYHNEQHRSEEVMKDLLNISHQIQSKNGTN